ncbi:ATP-binding protein [Thermomonas sp. HDW16]|uniref:sensor histidine kinase n=1 Tax=Thermomonas sp. HDW16 TaxID=2714945 RepID=UPI00140CA89A|nr:ATP-binding protein [Thermomonas sp. HDW16]QIL21413.1 PAS domain-containing sensor histidine kinase [Thermomonas sp. HDW16]
MSNTAASMAPREAIRRELYLLTLYRIFEAAVLCLVLFSPVGALMGEPRHLLLGQGVAIAYLIGAIALFAAGRHGDIRTQTLLGAALDIAAAALAMHALPQSSAGIAMMLLFNVGAAAFLLPIRLGLGMAVAASIALVGEYLWSLLGGESATRPLAEVLMFAVSYVAMATLTNQIGRQMRASEALAERRGSQVASLAEVNELIIRRMQTGVLLVDAAGEIKLANEAAMVQLGGFTEGRRDLLLAAPQLAARLKRWRESGDTDPKPLQLAPDLPEVQPRFARLLAEDDQALIFLDDTSQVVRRAESLTLAALGRFSASLAHEIRNPLAAISYATQLLEESREIPEADRRLLEIIYQQTMRMNGIVENVLGLARREQARPDHVELTAFVHHFADDYRKSHPLNDDQLEASATAPLVAMVDRRQLQQVVTVLVHNALVYGRLPGEPARVGIRVYTGEHGNPVLDVTDRGPGIPETVARQLFRPFFTTSGEGTGLGLYIARELCLANQASLNFVPIPGGGACFRIHLPGARAITTA